MEMFVPRLVVFLLCAVSVAVRGCQPGGLAKCMSSISAIATGDANKCRAMVDAAKTCVTSKLEGCSADVMKASMAPLAQLDEMCSASDSPCSILKIGHCQQGLSQLQDKDGKPKDPEAFCRHLPQVIVCVKELQPACRASIDSTEKTAFLEASKVPNMLMGNCPSTSGTFNPCSINELSNCLSTMPKSKEEAEEKKDAVCLALPKTKKCFKRIMKCDQKDLKDNIMGAYNGVEELQKICDNGVRAAGFSLITLVLTIATAKLAF